MGVEDYITKIIYRFATETIETGLRNRKISKPYDQMNSFEDLGSRNRAIILVNSGRTENISSI